MKKFFTCYHPRFGRSLVYLLQSSEYYMQDFIRAVVRTKDFANTERRGKLVFTSKVVILYSAVYLVQIGVSVSVIYFGLHEETLLALVLLALSPVLLIVTVFATLLCVAIPEYCITRLRVAQAQKIMQSHPGTVIAIAGSYGKTTTRTIISTILGEKFSVATPIKNHNTPLAVAKFIHTLTGKEDVIVIECGEYYPGDVRQLTTMIKPDVGIICGINEAHLARFGTIEATTRTIFELADELQDKIVYINADDARVAAHASPNHIRYSNNGIDHTKCTIVSSNLDGQTFTLTKGDSVQTYSTPCVGPHLIGTMILTIELARSLGLDDATIQAGLARVTNPPHRFALRRLTSGISILDDSYNGNPDGVRVMLSFLTTLENQRIVYVTPGLVELGTETNAVHERIADQLATAGLAHIILIDTPATAIIKSRLTEQGYSGLVTVVPEMTGILDKLDTVTLSGDLVVIQNDLGDNYL